MLLNFVPGGCTKIGQECDVTVNAALQAGCSDEVTRLQIERLQEQYAEDPGAVLRANVSRAQLKKDLPRVLAAGVERVRSLWVGMLSAAWEKTGASKAWEADFQRRAVTLHGQGRLFGGDRQEDLPYGQEVDEVDFESSEFTLPAGAAPRPTMIKLSARDLFVSLEREQCRAGKGFRTLAEAETHLKDIWNDMSASDKQAWEQKKKERNGAFAAALKAWKVEVKQFLRSPAPAPAPVGGNAEVDEVEAEGHESDETDEENEEDQEDEEDEEEGS